ncbi:MAG: hypothetical protein JST19_05475 [Bacteroidetes bacterium]|nr:hypothetical protein [Bacteroidota bacterium]
MKKILWLSFILLGVSCKKGIGPEPVVDINKIYGTWDWLSSSGGFAGGTETPQNTHTRMSLKITNGTMYSYRNDTLVSQRNFVVVKAKSFIVTQAGTDSSYFIHFTPQSLDQQIMAAQSNSLTLAEVADDGFISGYVRRK